MARDYVARNRRPPPKPAGLPGWVWLVAGLSIGLVVAAVVYIGRPVQPMPLSEAARSSVVKASKPAVQIPPAEKPRFDFYTLLEKEQVVVSSSTPAPANPPQPALTSPTAPPETSDPTRHAATTTATQTAPARATRYLVMAGAFQDARNAEEHKARLAFAGLESQIEQVQGQDGKTWHRVRIGPAPLARAQDQLAQLQANGFEGRVVRMP